MKRFAGFLFCGSCFALIMVFGAYIQVHGSTAQPAPSVPAAGEGLKYDYRVLATNKTSTMEKEMNLAAQAGYRFEAAMGGETSFGGSEAVAVMAKSSETRAKQHYEYKLLATSKTSTMEKEMQEAGNAGFTYRDQTVFKSTFGGKEVVVILERDRKLPNSNMITNYSQPQEPQPWKRSSGRQAKRAINCSASPSRRPRSEDLRWFPFCAGRLQNERAAS
jgi:hypothetical protein